MHTDEFEMNWTDFLNFANQQPPKTMILHRLIPAISAIMFSACFQLLLAEEIDQDPESPKMIPMKTAQEIVRAREIAFAKSFANRDLESFLTFISDEAVFFATHTTPLRGKEAIAKAWTPLIESETAPFSWGPDVVEVLDSGNLAISSGPIHDPTGKEVGRFNSIWRKEADGQWRVIFDKGS